MVGEQDFHRVDMQIDYFLKSIVTFLSKNSNFKELCQSKQFQVIRDNDGNLIMVSLKIKKLYLNMDSSGKYYVDLDQDIKSKGDHCISKKFSNQVISNEDGEDYIRLDFKPNLEFPNYHINVSEKKFGKHHYIYPSDTKLDISKTNPITSLNIFQKYIKTGYHPILCEHEYLMFL